MFSFNLICAFRPLPPRGCSDRATWWHSGRSPYEMERVTVRCCPTGSSLVSLFTEKVFSEKFLLNLGVLLFFKDLWSSSVTLTMQFWRKSHPGHWRTSSENSFKNCFTNLQIFLHETARTQFIFCPKAAKRLSRKRSLSSCFALLFSCSFPGIFLVNRFPNITHFFGTLNGYFSHPIINLMPPSNGYHRVHLKFITFQPRTLGPRGLMVNTVY